MRLCCHSLQTKTPKCDPSQTELITFTADQLYTLDIKKSLIGFSVSSLALMAWMIVFQLYWRSWGDIGQALLVVPVNDPSNW